MKKKGSFRSSESSSRTILSSRVRWSRLENTVPSWMRQAKGKAKTLDRAWVSTATAWQRSEEHTSELQSRQYLVCRLLLEKKNKEQDEPHACACSAALREHRGDPTDG